MAASHLVFENDRVKSAPVPGTAKASSSKLGLTPASDRASVRKRFEALSPYAQYASSPSPRSNVPSSISQAENATPLQKSLIRSWTASEPSDRFHPSVATLLDQLTRMVNDRMGWYGDKNRDGDRFKVEVFGSVSWGGQTKSGDIDLVVLDYDLPLGYLWSDRNGAVAPRHPVYNVRTLQRKLQQEGMIKTMSIKANTPIVKFSTRYGATEFDICANDLGGWYNSSLILHYCEISPFLLRPLIHGVKSWASAFHINDGAGGRGPVSLSSYNLVNMIIAYLQHRGLLPNLQAEVSVPSSDNIDCEEEDVVWTAWGKPRGVKARIAFDKRLPKGWKSAKPDMTAAEALRGFIDFYDPAPPANNDSDRFDYDKQLVSILNGGVLERTLAHSASVEEERATREELRDEGMPNEEIQAHLREREKHLGENENLMGKGDRGVQPRAWGGQALIIQDPFVWNRNNARAIAPKGWENIQEAFTRTNALLHSKPKLTFEQMIKNTAPDPYIQVKKDREAKAQRKQAARGGYQGQWNTSFRPAPAPAPRTAVAASSVPQSQKRRAPPPETPVGKKSRKSGPGRA